MEEGKCQHVNHKSKCYGENIYNKVGNDKRLALLTLVKERGTSLKEAASKLGINYSTAKTILRVYRIENRILKKAPNQKRAKRKFEIYSSHLDPDQLSLINCSSSPRHNNPSNASNISNVSNVSNASNGSQQNNPSSHRHSPKPESESTHLSDEFYKNPEELVLHFKAIINNLQCCINEVINNENTIKNICTLLQNIPQFQQYNNFNFMQGLPHFFHSQALQQQ